MNFIHQVHSIHLYLQSNYNKVKYFILNEAYLINLIHSKFFIFVIFINFFFENNHQREYLILIELYHISTHHRIKN